MITHRELYPTQYTHPLVGRCVRVINRKTKDVITEGIAERVVDTRFGKLVHLEDGGNTFYAISDCQTLAERKPS